MFGQPVRLVDWLPIIRGEFEHPADLRLTIEEARRRWSVDAVALEAILETFVRVGYLRRSADGSYYRRGDGGTA